MIKKLSQRIFLIIMLSLLFVILGIIILFAFLNYNNTINTATFMMDKFIKVEPKRGMENNREKLNIDGVYDISVENSKIIPNQDVSYDNKINEYAIRIFESNSEKGIIGKYIYKVRKVKENAVNITFMENETAILHIKIIIIFSISASIISIVIIYIIAKKLSRIIVRPVQETFEKQKQFISDASHELKTPLAVIEANADVLKNEIGTNKWLGYIQNEIDSMDKLINELLLLTKIENIDNIREYNQFDMSKEVEIIISMFESMAYENKINIKSNIQENIIMNGNKEDIEHVVSVLIDNAIKHTEVKKDIIIEARKEKNEIILEVKNMGNPIPEDEQEKIFERFYRIDKSRNRKEKRYGLGLAIAKSIVQKYNGKIEVFYKNNYTIFKVAIPN